MSSLNIELVPKAPLIAVKVSKTPFEVTKISPEEAATEVISVFKP